MLGKKFYASTVHIKPGPDELLHLQGHREACALVRPPGLLNLASNAIRNRTRLGLVDRMAPQHVAKLRETTDQSQASKQI